MKYLKKFEGQSIADMFKKKFDQKFLLKELGVIKLVQHSVIRYLNELFNKLGFNMDFNFDCELKSQEQDIMPIMKNHTFKLPTVTVDLSIRDGHESLLLTLINTIYPESTSWGYPVNRKGIMSPKLRIVFVNDSSKIYFKDNLDNSSLLLTIEQKDCTTNDVVRILIIEKILEAYKSFSNKYIIQSDGAKTFEAPYIRQIIITYLEGLLKSNGLASEEQNYKLIGTSINSSKEAFKIYDILKKENIKLYKQLKKYTNGIDTASELGGLGF